jgi:accessory gene regulator B
MMAISISFTISFCLIFLYAPSDTKSKPIVSKSLRKKLKIKALLMAFILFLFVLFLKDIVYKNIITYAVLTESLCLTPILYKFLGKEYNNYEKFKSTTT